MQFQLIIDMNNAAFTNDDGEPAYGPELARILRKLADNFAEHDDISGSALVRDINGNSVGVAKFVED